jgi:hypothetical protein
MNRRIYGNGAKASLCCALLGSGLSLAAAADWDEGVDGDLSDDPDAPTVLAFSVGANSVTGDMVSPSDTRDFLTFTIAPGQQLTALLLQQYQDLDTGGPGDRGFHAINDGPTSFVPGPDTAGLFLGGAHLDPAPAGTDLLVVLGAAPQAGTGFTPPLGPGTYSYVVQQTGTEFTGYSLDFVVEETPVQMIGGSVTDTRGAVAVCRNNTVPQSVQIPLGGGDSWDCTGAGLSASAGDLVLQIVVGFADCAGGACGIGGSATGVNVLATVCRNLATGQSVTVPGIGGSSWDCSGGGLNATTGDQTLQVIVGSATVAPEASPSDDEYH